MVSMDAFQAFDGGSIPPERICLFCSFKNLHIDSRIAVSHAKPLENVDPVVVPIYHSTIYRIKSYDHLTSRNHGENHVYRRCGNPTTDNFEVILNELEAGAGCLSYNSGLSAVSSVLLEFLSAGSHLIVMVPCYNGTVSFVTQCLPRFHVDVTFVDVETENERFAEAIETRLRPNTHLIYLESIANPTMAVPDVAGAVDVARRHGVRVCVDATFSSPYLFQPLKHGVDISLHSCSKYVGGHCDVIGGAVTVANVDDWKRLKLQQIAMGTALSPQDASLLTRGMKTLALRMDRHSENGLKVAEWLEEEQGNAKVTRVLYPGLRSHPQHEFARQIMRKHSGMVAFDVGSERNAKQLIQNLKLITHAISLGGTHSLIEHPYSIRPKPPVSSPIPPISPGLLRLSVGIENVQDIIFDLKQAIENL